MPNVWVPVRSRHNAVSLICQISSMATDGTSRWGQFTGFKDDPQQPAD